MSRFPWFGITAPLPTTPAWEWSARLMGTGQRMTPAGRPCVAPATGWAYDHQDARPGSRIAGWVAIYLVGPQELLTCPTTCAVGCCRTT